MSINSNNDNLRFGNQNIKQPYIQTTPDTQKTPGSLDSLPSNLQEGAKVVHQLSSNIEQTPISIDTRRLQTTEPTKPLSELAKSSLVEGGNGYLTSKVWQLHHVENTEDGDVLCYILAELFDPFFPGNAINEAARNFSESNQIAAVEPHPVYSLIEAENNLPIKKESIDAWVKHSPEFVKERVKIMVQKLANSKNGTWEAQVIAAEAFPNFMLNLTSYNSAISFEENCEAKTKIILKQFETQKSWLKSNFKPDEEKRVFFERLGFSYGYDEALKRWILKSPTREFLQNRWNQMIKEMPDMPPLSFAPCKGVATHLEFVTAHLSFDRLVADGENAFHDNYSHVLSLIENLYGIHKGVWYFKNSREEITTPAKIYEAYKNKLTSEIKKAVDIITQYRNSSDLPPKCRSAKEKEVWLSIWEAMLAVWVDNNTAINLLVSLEKESRSTRTIYTYFHDQGKIKSGPSNAAKFLPEGDLYFRPDFPREECIEAWNKAFDAMSQ